MGAADRRLGPPQIVFRQQSTDEVETSLGRPVTTEWMVGVVTAFKNHAPHGSLFEPRLIPGIAYLSGAEWAHRQLHVPTELVTEETTAATMAKFIAKRVADGTLDTTAAEPQSFDVADKFRVRPNDSAGRSWGMVIRDKPTPAYQEGYMIDGERNGLRTAASSQTEDFLAHDRFDHRHIVVLGLISVPPNIGIRQFVADMTPHVSSEINFDPIGILRK